MQQTRVGSDLLRRTARRRRRPRAFVGLTIAASVGLAACASDGSSSDRVAAGSSVQRDTVEGGTVELDQATMQLQIPENGLFSPVWYGVEHGIYAEHGIELNILPGVSSQAAVDAVARGDADFSSSSFAGVVLNQVSGNPIVGIAEFVRGGNEGLLVGADTGITSWDDLPGKRVIITTGSSQQPLYEVALSAAGVDPSSVEVINLNPTLINQTFASGEGDAVLTLFPFSEPQISKTREVEALPYGAAGVEIPGFFLIANEDAVAEDPDLAQRFINATMQSWAAAYRNPDDAVAAMLQSNPALNVEDATATFAAFVRHGCGVNDTGTWFGDFSSSDLEEGFRTLVASGLVEDDAVDLAKAFPRDALDALPEEDRVECSTMEVGS